MRFPRRISAPLLLCLGFTLCATARAQTATTGAIVGRVVDSSGAAIPGATVTVRNTATGDFRQTTAGPQGEFRFSSLPPDAWNVILGHAGFAPREIATQVTVSRANDLGAVTLPITGTVTVAVHAAALLETQSPEVGATITPEEIDNLPVNAQRWQNFTLLAPTAVLDPETNSISFHAAPSTANTDLLNGADDSQGFAPGDNTRSRMDSTVSSAAVREFHALTTSYDTQHGRAVGAVVDTVTRSGTNTIHGEARYFARDSEWSNVSPAAPVTLPQPDGSLLPVDSLPRDWRQQGDVRIGGPIVRNRAFWHITYEREHRSFPAIGTVSDAPTLFFSQALPGDLTGYNPVGTSCKSLIYTNVASMQLRGTGSETDPTLYGSQGACYLNLFDSTEYPSYAQASAAYNNALAYLYSLTGEAARERDTQLLSPEADMQLGRTHLLVSYHRARTDSLGGGNQQPYAARSVSSFGNDGLKQDGGSAQLDTFVTTSVVNTLRGGYSHTFDYESRQTPLPQEPLTALNGTAPPGVEIARQFSFGTLPSEIRGAYPEEYRAQLYDAVSLTRGSHTLRAGAEWQHVNDHIQQLYAAAGEYHYSNVQNFLIDAATADAVPDARCGLSGTAQTTCYSRYVQGLGTPGGSFTVNEWAAFLEDQWRVTPRFTVNAGLRYEYQRLPPPEYPNPLLPGSASTPGDANNFGPRGGVAWQVRRGMVLRAGAGLYFGTTPGNAIYNAQIATGAANSQQIYTLYGSSSAPLRYPDTLISVPPGGPVKPDVTVFARNFQQPQVALFSLDVQQQMGTRTVFTLGGVAALGRELPIVVDTNLNPPGGSVTYDFTGGPLNGTSYTVPVYTGARPNSNFGAIRTIESRANSQYTAMTAQLERRASNSLDLRVAYTWSHALDDGERSTVTGLNNQVLSPDNFSLQRGTSSLDRRQRLAASAIWQPHVSGLSGWRNAITNGWLAAPVLQTASGAPYSARMLGDPPGGSPNYRTSYGYLGAGGDDFLPLLGRNSFLQPYTAVLDLRLGRKFAFGHRYRMEIFGEAFNLLNHTNVSGYAGRAAVDDDAYQIGSGQTAGLPVVATYRPTFGQVVEQDSQPLFTRRQIQLGARLTF